MELKYKQCEICGKPVEVYPGQYSTCPTCGTAIMYDDVKWDATNAIRYEYNDTDEHFWGPIHRIERQVRAEKKSITAGEFIGLFLLSLFVIPLGTIITGIISIKHARTYPEYKRYKFLIAWSWAWLFLSADIWIPVGIWLFRLIKTLI